MRIFRSFFILTHIKGDYKIKNLNLKQIWEVMMRTETKWSLSKGEEWEWDGKENRSTHHPPTAFQSVPSQVVQASFVTT